MTDDSIFQDFKDLYKAYDLFEYDKYIIKDGIINEKLYRSQNVKILVVAKEHNFKKNSENPNGYEGDYREWWNKHVHFSFSHRISEWCFGIFDEFETNYNNITYDQKFNALKSIAFINVKKTGGGAFSKNDIISNYIEKSKNLLHRQILNINPHIILCCFYYDFHVTQLLGIQMTRSNSNSYSIGTWMGKKIINLHHPSSRKKKEFLFEQVAKAVKS